MPDPHGSGLPNPLPFAWARPARERSVPARGTVVDWTAEYLDLEVEVQREMGLLCRTACASCRRPCCKPVFCAESSESAFLRSIARATGELRQGGPRGWLGPKGCRLAVGRPPICYEYLCPRILAPLGPEQRWAANALGQIVSWVGAEALDGRHLVELGARELDRVRPAPRRARLHRAVRALAACRRVLAGADPNGLDRRAMAGVSPLP